MEINAKKRIYIVGSVGSGKTTLAKRLSLQLNTPWYELDNVFHERIPKADRGRAKGERELVFKNILDSEKWIIEGVRRECFDEGFMKADIIIFLNTPQFIRQYRITRRWIRQKLKLEKCEYNADLNMLSKMFQWSKSFEKSKGELLKLLQPYKEKLVIMKNNDIESTKKLYEKK